MFEMVIFFLTGVWHFKITGWCLSTQPLYNLSKKASDSSHIGQFADTLDLYLV